MLPTDEKSKLFIGKISGQLHDLAIADNDESTINQHLYIISDEEIKESDYVYENNLNNNHIYQVYKRNDELGIFRFQNVWIKLNKSGCKKVIATTDKSLNLPEPSQSFIQKYISEYNKGNIITEILVEYEEIVKPKNCSDFYNECFINVDSKNNTITIKKVKNCWNREEVIKLLDDFDTDFGDTTKEQFNKWIEENLY